MLPLSLTIEGLYSYQTRQTINFEQLTEAGLFGIFGAVGSGKSSILEAISFALYGETERLNSRDKRAYNMMNLRSDTSFISFEFLNFENRKFKAERKFKRNSKNFEDVKSPSVVFYAWKNDNWIPLEHSNAEQIIGLSYANFKRTIIIPQGQFKEFLELGATERTTMMKEIFNLQKFDLQNKTAQLFSENKSVLDQLEGKLSGFEEINEATINAQKELLDAEKIQLENAQKEFDKIQEQYQNLKNLKADFELLEKKKTDFGKLEKDKIEVDLLEKKTEQFDAVSRIFQPLINEKNRLEKDSKLQKEARDHQQISLTKTETIQKSIKDKLEDIQPRFDKLNQSRNEENDLILILQMLKFSEEIQLLKTRLEKGNLKLKDVEKQQKSHSNNIENLQLETQKLKSQKLDSELLLKVGNWFSDRKKLTESLSQQTKKITDKTAEIASITEEFKLLNVNPETFSEDFKKEIDNVEKQQKLLSEKKNQLEVQKKLAQFASALHDGEACPLCGSHEHPHVVEFDDVNDELKNIENQIANSEAFKVNIQKKNSEFEKIRERKEIFEKQLLDENKILQDLQQSLKTHENQFIWPEFQADNEKDFEEKRKQTFEIEKQIENLTQQLQAEQNALEKERKNYENYRNALDQFKEQEALLQGKLSSNENNLKILYWNNFQEKSYVETENLHQNLAEENKKTEENYQKLINEEKEISLKLSVCKTEIKNLDHRILQLEKELNEILATIKKALEHQQFAALETVLEILAEEIDVVKNREFIKTFDLKYNSLKNSIQELQTKLKNFSFDAEKFSAVENEFIAAETALKSRNDSVVKITAEAARLEEEFKKKEFILQELSKVKKRQENLSVMKNLFNGAGFVRFVSSMYLRQLCDHANVRFHRMTRNQLSLQLNENHDFEIIDYLNEGRSRSVKTLSGGQAFQVSLSLALALAESVQSNAQADKNFFFIDEGFGTQDAESVSIVFETLSNLQKENRIVGIISHVDELKEKIPAALQITKDEGKGSLIEVI